MPPLFVGHASLRLVVDTFTVKAQHPFTPVYLCAIAEMPVGHQFSPYTSNGGSIMAIHGDDYCVIAGDTRQSEGYNIQTRYKPKVFRLYVRKLC